MKRDATWTPIPLIVGALFFFATGFYLEHSTATPTGKRLLVALGTAIITGILTYVAVRSTPKQ